MSYIDAAIAVAETALSGAFSADAYIIDSYPGRKYDMSEIAEKTGINVDATTVEYEVVDRTGALLAKPSVLVTLTKKIGSEAAGGHASKAECSEMESIVDAVAACVRAAFVASARFELGPVTRPDRYDWQEMQRRVFQTMLIFELKDGVAL